MRGRRLWLRIALAAAVVGVVLAVYTSGLDDQLRPDAIRALLLDAGPWGPPLFWAIFALGEMVAIPSVLFVIVAGITWPRESALAISWVGAVVSATSVFVVARYLARDLVQGRMPARLRWLESWTESRPLLGVILIRLVTFMAPWTHLVLAVSRVRVRDYVLGTAIGVIPAIVALVLAGEAASEFLPGVPGWVWLLVGLFVVAQMFRSGRVATLEPGPRSPE
ncbi:MAG: VTT domain-containing protein [Myxococcales bacterium]|nr:VTT domain-containing protein [Myxococcales bacterium]